MNTDINPENPENLYPNTFLGLLMITFSDCPPEEDSNRNEASKPEITLRQSGTFFRSYFAHFSK